MQLQFVFFIRSKELISMSFRKGDSSGIPGVCISIVLFITAIEAVHKQQMISAENKKLGMIYRGSKQTRKQTGLKRSLAVI